MSITSDYEFSFKAPNGVPSMCRIRTYEVKEGFHKGDTIVICSQLPEGDERAGMSVTNAAETIATEIMHKHKLTPMRMVWIEHYPPRGQHNKLEESLDRVTFEARLHATRATSKTLEGRIVLAHPQWNHHVPRAVVTELIGETF